jgi:hypothetical protein
MSEVILRFNGHRHVADKVLGKASRTVEVAYKDINTDATLVEYSNVPPGSDPLYGGSVVFIHFGGKYIPLMGRAKVFTGDPNPERIIKGMLITSVALKAARIDDGFTKPSGPVTLKTPSEDVRVSQIEQTSLKNFDGLRDKFTNSHRPTGPRQIQQNYGGANRPESATGSSLRSRSPYRGTLKRNGV